MALCLRKEMEDYIMRVHGGYCVGVFKEKKAKLDIKNTK